MATAHPCRYQALCILVESGMVVYEVVSVSC